MTSTLASASAPMHPTVSPSSSDDSDFSVASLRGGLPETERDEGYNVDPVGRALRRYSLSLAQYTADRFEESENAALAQEGATSSTAAPSSTAQDNDKPSKCEKSQRSERDAATALSRGMPSHSTTNGGMRR